MYDEVTINFEYTQPGEPSETSGIGSTGLESRKVRFGKYKGFSFEEVAEMDPDYCEWVMTQKGETKNRNMEEIIRYLKQRESEEKAKSPKGDIKKDK